MAEISKAEYLKRYLSASEVDEKKKKRRKVTKPTSKHARSKIIDDDVDLKSLIPDNIDNTLDDDIGDNDPTIVAIIDERPDDIQQLESYRHSDGRWKTLGKDDRFDPSLIKSIKDEDILKNKKSLFKDNKFSDKKDSKIVVNNRNRHDADFDESVTRKHKNNQSYSRRQRHDSDSDQSQPRTKRHDSDSDQSLPRKHRHDSDSDQSLPRKHRHDSDSDQSLPQRHDSDSSPPRKSRISKNEREIEKKQIRRKRHDSDSDESPPRKGNRHDSDESPPRRGNRHDSDESPPRRGNRHDSDESPPRRGNRHDSDESPPRKGKRHDSDESPPRRRLNRSDSDISPPRRGRRKKQDSESDNSPPRKKRQDSDSDNSPPRKKEKMDKTLSGKTAGLSSARDMKIEADKLKKKENEAFGKISNEALGRDAQTVFRDRKTGKRRNMREEAEKGAEQLEKERQMKEKYEKWGKGMKQQEQQQKNIEEHLYETSKPLARFKDDDDLDQQLKDMERADDPMLQFIKKKKPKDAKKTKELPRYKGPAPPPNRFNIMPGYRWDGVDRSNGFEAKYFASLSKKKAVSEEAYKWSVEDM